MLDEILPLIKKPVRYTGGEYNVTIKNKPEVYVGIVFPEIYEIGMSNLGIKIIYHLFNQNPLIQCERVFAPWPDFGDRLLARKIPLFGLETKKPIKEFDLLGFSLQSELNYTNVLYVLDLAEIPYRSKERTGQHPIIIAGGPCTLNPAPLSPVFDAFIIGDGEEIVPEISKILVNIPNYKKEERLKEMAKLPGVWVPEIHHYEKIIKKITAPSLNDDAIPAPIILPICDITHDRFAIEVMRGCMWGCRFCQAGYANRPLRIRPELSILKAVERGIRDTGWEEVALLSFSILDYPNLLNLIRKLNEILKKKRVNVSLPAMRGEMFTKELAILLKEIKKSGLTFAPETASEGLRCRINKQFSNEQLISSIRLAYEEGWHQIKLYFMIGLPFEKEDDVEEICKLVKEIKHSCPKGNIKLAVSPFVPKPHTPFESAEFAPLEELNHRIEILKKIRKGRVVLNYQDPEVSFIEACLSRGDENLFMVIEEVYREGGKFEQWREGFDFSRWQKAFEKIGIEPREYLKRREKHPWDFIDIGVSKKFLSEEFRRATQGIVTENCYYGECTNCGICEGEKGVKFRETSEKYLSSARTDERKQAVNPVMYRVKYSIGEIYRYASHLDITRTIYRALRRTDLPIQFTLGFSPLPRVSFGPPKSVGQISKGDYFDFYLISEYFGNISMELNTKFPPGIRILDVRAMPSNTPSLSSSINLIYYEVTIPESMIRRPLDFSHQKPVYIWAGSETRNICDSVESISYKDGTLTCGLYYGAKNINIYQLCSYLTEIPVEETRLFKVTRTLLFIKRNGLLYSPMEVK